MNTEFKYWRDLVDDIYFEKLEMIHKGKDVHNAIEKAYLDLLAQPERMARTTASDFKRLVNAWLSNERLHKEEKPRAKLL